MEGSAEDLAPPPDSWEVADLEVTVSKLILSSSSSSKKDSSPAPLSTAPSSSSSSSSASRDGSGQGVIGGVSEDIVVNSVDQFLREALQNPRERLSGNVLTLGNELLFFHLIGLRGFVFDMVDCFCHLWFYGILVNCSVF